MPYFLSRPRRFGKSLLLSAMSAYWEGKKELFSGLKIEALEAGEPDPWKAYPVFYFDFDGDDYGSTPIETVLDGMLRDWEEKYGDQFRDRTLGDRFQKLLELAYQKTGRRCVILIDEYDKPLMDMAGQPERQEHIKEVFKGFFSRLKKADESIHFIFITGVTKFYKVSVFSDLNQLTDISLEEEYSTLCGITDAEIRAYFMPEIRHMANRRGMTDESCINKLREQYDGYRFHPQGLPVYNPYSLLTALRKKEFGAYWYETGTPAFLIKSLKKSAFDLRKLTDKSLYASEAVLKDYIGDNLDPIPLMYQSGYLTIADYDAKKNRYTLCFPNQEVKYGFVESMIPAYIPKATAGNSLDIS